MIDFLSSKEQSSGLVLLPYFTILVFEKLEIRGLVAKVID